MRNHPGNERRQWFTFWKLYFFIYIWSTVSPAGSVELFVCLTVCLGYLQMVLWSCLFDYVSAMVISVGSVKLSVYLGICYSYLWQVMWSCLFDAQTKRQITKWQRLKREKLKWQIMKRQKLMMVEAQTGRRHKTAEAQNSRDAKSQKAQNSRPPVVKLEGGPAVSVKPGQKSSVRTSGIITLVARGPSDSSG